MLISEKQSGEDIILHKSYLLTNSDKAIFKFKDSIVPITLKKIIELEQLFQKLRVVCFGSSISSFCRSCVSRCLSFYLLS